ncbi:hypothetical protein [Leptotrichia wadei]|uniref:hypothetical protein n=1 Tax=Leptotrichia wadei TaxID=157687 RepID=UPI0028E7047B|nr:hypothetical protein [Leptotrichia wadei]
MKKLFLAFMLLTPVAMAYGERNEIIISPIYGKQKNNNDKNAPVKGVTGSGIKISLEGKGGVDDDVVMGLGMGLTYNSLKVKGKDINSNSGSLVSIPVYLMIGTGTDNGIYSKFSFGASLAGGSVKWTDKNGGSGKIKAMPLNGYGAIGIGVQKNRFSFGINGIVTPRLKRQYSSSTKRYNDKFSDSVVSLEFGYQPNYKD